MISTNFLYLFKTMISESLPIKIKKEKKPYFEHILISEWTSFCKNRNRQFSSIMASNSMQNIRQIL